MTENNISSASDTITMYCTQPDLVWDIVDKDGNVLVKKNHMVTPKRAELICKKEISRHCLDF